jgi:hypothetical protein
MSQVTIGIFTNREMAERAVRALGTAGYDPKRMSVMTRNVQEGEQIVRDTGTNVMDGAASGVTTGGVLGGLAGLLIGVGAIAVPGVGGLLIGGPIAIALGLSGAAATTVSGAVTGAVAGGLLGALIGLGVPEETARVYEERISQGGILLAVPSMEAEDAQVRNIMEESGAEQLQVVSADSKKWGW